MAYLYLKRTIRANPAKAGDAKLKSLQPKKGHDSQLPERKK